MANKHIDSINYKYLGVSVVLLIICYYFLQKNGNKLQPTSITQKNIQRKSISVYTKNGNVMMDPNMLEMYLQKIKKYIIELSDNFSCDDCSYIAQFISHAKKHTSLYIYIQKANVNYNDSTRFNVLENFLNERDTLKESMEYDDDSDTRQKNMIRYSILDLLVDIDIIMLLIRGSLCTTGSLNLNTLDDLVVALYQSKISNKEYSYTKSQSYNSPIPEPDLTFNSFENMSDFLPIQSSSNRLEGSQQVEDKTTLKDIYKKRNMKDDHKNRSSVDNTLLLSHELSPDFNDIIPARGSAFITSPYQFDGAFPKTKAVPDLDVMGRSSLL